jgi:disulfide bond formation protein DsbB
LLPLIERTFGVLALVALASAVVGIAALVTRRVPSWLDEVALPLATAIAVVATGGSLYLSEVAGYLPCALCWYQRIAMYPLTIVLGVAALRGDRQVWRTALPLTVIGAGVSVWHIAIERNPSLGGGVCDPAAPCAIRWVEEFGFLTLPTMALIAFLAIGVLSLVAARAATAATARSDDHDRTTTSTRSDA